MRILVMGAVAATSLSACHGANCDPSSPAALTVDKTASMADAAETTALDTVYERHPTRALVESAATVRTSDDPDVFESRIEMTGSPETRAIYEVEITADAAGKLSVTGFNKLQ